MSSRLRREAEEEEALEARVPSSTCHLLLKYSGRGAAINKDYVRFGGNTGGGSAWRTKTCRDRVPASVRNTGQVM